MDLRGLVGLATALVALGVAVSPAAERADKRGERISGTRGDDRLVGTPGPDRIKGKGGADLLAGKRGADILSGGAGADRLIGGPGADVLRGGPGRDEFNMRAGVEIPSPGRDRIHARDGVPEEISCGAGRDVAFVDEVENGVYDCERVIAR